MMGKKKHKDRHGDKHGHKHETGHDAKRGDGAARSGSFSLPLAGIAAMVTQQLQSPAARAAMATGLRAAADALAKPASPPTPPVPPVPPQSEAAGTVPPVQPAAPQGTTRSPNPDAIAGAIGEAAELVLARLFGKKG
ncbi:hypothetical protein [Sphingomonas sp. CFBP 8760]|uniref:hypothetical protein n=1 Tax=Sphingomonas sp. CFBP 8760 TaxID=2775282 RepID=UPI00178725F9|nr:hypothetical protein [Sphingomonas sp. CFBP 8760]MBD8546101.1 hypothetical protein [Sphingomonas sp. CFBP 8760]